MITNYICFRVNKSFVIETKPTYKRKMKYQARCNIVITVFLFLNLLGQQNVTAQDTIKSWSLNLQLTHFIAKDHDHNNYFIPLNPGVEILYKHELYNKLAVLLGVNYSYSHWKYKFSSGNQARRLAHEVAIPLLFERSFGNNYFVTFGSYAGWLVSAKDEYIYNNSTDWIDTTEHTNYNETSKFTCDLYLGIGFLLKGNPKHQIILEPFVKYKIKDNWMGEVRTKTYFGLNIKF